MRERVENKTSTKLSLNVLVQSHAITTITEHVKISNTSYQAILLSNNRWVNNKLLLLILLILAREVPGLE